MRRTDFTWSLIIRLSFITAENFLIIIQVVCSKDILLHDAPVTPLLPFKYILL